MRIRMTGRGTEKED